MITPHLVEALLSGLIRSDEACACYPELGQLRHRAQGSGSPVPLQWALCVAGLPLACGLVRHTVEALLELLDRLDAAWDEGLVDGCPLWHALEKAPDWLLRPDEPDDNVPDIALLLERDETYGGDWQALIEELHQAGSRRWQWAIRRCRAMQRYEALQDVSLRDLLEPPAMITPVPAPPRQALERGPGVEVMPKE